MICGILSLSNGTGLNYPFLPVVRNLAALCDKVIVGLDPSFLEDFAALHALVEAETLNVEIVPAVWDKSNIKDGCEIAIQMDRLTAVAAFQGASWVVVPQADELFLDDDFPMLRAFMERAGPDTIGFSTERLYFWGAFDKVRKDWNATLVRIFRPGTFSFMAPGTDKAGMYSASIVPGSVVDLPYKIYHYSRMGSPQDISKRIRNLDGFFHPDESLVPREQVPAYDFVARPYDNYAVSGMPLEIEGKFENYTGTHPRGIKEWFGGIK
jgi:hypothetical protein